MPGWSADGAAPSVRSRCASLQSMRSIWVVGLWGSERSTGCSPDASPSHRSSWRSARNRIARPAAAVGMTPSAIVPNRPVGASRRKRRRASGSVAAAASRSSCAIARSARPFWGEAGRLPLDHVLEDPPGRLVEERRRAEDEAPRVRVGERRRDVHVYPSRRDLEDGRNLVRRELHAQQSRRPARQASEEVDPGGRERLEQALEEVHREVHPQRTVDRGRRFRERKERRDWP